jgi:hypothetical protein
MARILQRLGDTMRRRTVSASVGRAFVTGR